MERPSRPLPSGAAQLVCARHSRGEIHGVCCCDRAYRGVCRRRAGARGLRATELEHGQQRGCVRPVGAPPELTDAQKKTLVAELPAAYQGADLSNGEAKFAVCRACHTLNQGGDDMTGPNLWGIFGRKAGSKAGFAYSDDMKNAGWTWDAARIDTWITNPHGVLPGTKMTFIGMPNATDRRDVIAFLKVQTTPPPKG